MIKIDQLCNFLAVKMGISLEVINIKFNAG